MAPEWKPVSEDYEEFRRQFAEADERERMDAAIEPRAVRAWYDAERDLVMTELRNGCVFGFPPHLDPKWGLADGTPEQLAEVEVEIGGEGLHWESLDADLALPGVIGWLLNVHLWAAKWLGHLTSPAKAAASRRNGRLGGRPPSPEPEVAPTSGGGVRVRSFWKDRTRAVVLERGAEYVVEPLNPRATRNRGRRVTVEGVGEAAEGRVEVRYADTGRRGRVGPSDLVPAPPDDADPAA